MDFYVIAHLAEDRGPVAPTGTFKLVRIHVIDFISQWCESTIYLPFQGSSADSPPTIDPNWYHLEYVNYLVCVHVMCKHYV